MNTELKTAPCGGGGGPCICDLWAVSLVFLPISWSELDASDASKSAP